MACGLIEKRAALSYPWPPDAITFSVTISTSIVGAGLKKRVNQNEAPSIASEEDAKRNQTLARYHHSGPHCLKRRKLFAEEKEHMETSVTHTALLAHKRAVIFGAGGAVGSAVAREFAAQGATVFLSGRRRSAVEQMVTDIQRSGGSAHAAEVDALDEQAVQAYLSPRPQRGKEPRERWAGASGRGCVGGLGEPRIRRTVARAECQQWFA
jgi:hypothetical protein